MLFNPLFIGLQNNQITGENPGQFENKLHNIGVMFKDILKNTSPDSLVEANNTVNNDLSKVIKDLNLLGNIQVSVSEKEINIESLPLVKFLHGEASSEIPTGIKSGIPEAKISGLDIIPIQQTELTNAENKISLTQSDQPLLFVRSSDKSIKLFQITPSENEKITTTGIISKLLSTDDTLTDEINILSAKFENTGKLNITVQTENGIKELVLINPAKNKLFNDAELPINQSGTDAKSVTIEKLFNSFTEDDTVVNSDLIIADSNVIKDLLSVKVDANENKTESSTKESNDKEIAESKSREKAKIPATEVTKNINTSETIISGPVNEATSKVAEKNNSDTIITENNSKPKVVAENIDDNISVPLKEYPKENKETIQSANNSISQKDVFDGKYKQVVASEINTAEVENNSKDVNNSPEEKSVKIKEDVVYIGIKKQSSENAANSGVNVTKPVNSKADNSVSNIPKPDVTSVENIKTDNNVIITSEQNTNTTTEVVNKQEVTSPVKNDKLHQSQEINQNNNTSDNEGIKSEPKPETEKKPIAVNSVQKNDIAENIKTRETNRQVNDFAKTTELSVKNDISKSSEIKTESDKSFTATSIQPEKRTVSEIQNNSTTKVAEQSAPNSNNINEKVTKENSTVNQVKQNRKPVVFTKLSNDINGFDKTNTLVSREDQIRILKEAGIKDNITIKQVITDQVKKLPDNLILAGQQKITERPAKMILSDGNNYKPIVKELAGLAEKNILSVTNRKLTDNIVHSDINPKAANNPVIKHNLKNISQYSDIDKLFDKNKDYEKFITVTKSNLNQLSKSETQVAKDFSLGVTQKTDLTEKAIVQNSPEKVILNKEQTEVLTKTANSEFVVKLKNIAEKQDTVKQTVTEKPDTKDLGNSNKEQIFKSESQTVNKTVIRNPKEVELPEKSAPQDIISKETPETKVSVTGRELLNTIEKTGNIKLFKEIVDIAGKNPTKIFEVSVSENTESAERPDNIKENYTVAEPKKVVTSEKITENKIRQDQNNQEQESGAQSNNSNNKQNDRGNEQGSKQRDLQFVNKQTERIDNPKVYSEQEKEIQPEQTKKTITEKTGKGYEQSEQHSTVVNQDTSVNTSSDKEFIKENVAISGHKTDNDFIKPVMNQPVAETYKSVKLNNLVQEISRFIELKQNNSISFRVTPEHLGSVKVSLKLVKDVVKASIEVENEQIKKVVESSISTLKNSLNINGLNTGEINVFVSQQQAGKGNKFITDQKKRDKSFSDKLDNVEGNEQYPSGEIKDKQRKYGYNTYEFTA